MAATDDPAEQQRLEQRVGHPQKRFEALCQRIQDEQVTQFTQVERDFLDLMWCYDAHRIAQVVPAGMGKQSLGPGPRLGGVYRGKGDRFSTVLSLILNNLTTSQLASRSRVMGFSQPHQIDIAWPTRDVTPIIDPLICCEAKLTGAPAYADNSGRKAMADWSNRRKELKFQATDLKLYRQSAKTRIENWDYWRRKAPPSVYSLWAARLSEGDNVAKMIQEARILTATYCDGVGIYAFQVNATNTGYEAAPMSASVDQRVTSLDSVLDLIAAEIRDIMTTNKGVPKPVIAPTHAASTEEEF